MSPPDVYRLLAEDIASNGTGGHGDVWETITHLVDPTELRPKLADDIEIRVFEQRWGEGYVMIANPRDLLHFRLAASDVGLLQLMDGTRTVKEIVVERFGALASRGHRPAPGEAGRSRLARGRAAARAPGAIGVTRR